MTEIDTWARDMFKAMDAGDFDALRNYLADNLRFRMANFPVAEGYDAFQAGAEANKKFVKQFRHDILGIWTGTWSHGDVIAIEADVTYDLLDGRRIVLQATSTIRRQSSKAVDYRVFMDPSPLYESRPTG